MTSQFGPLRLICNARAGRGGVGRALPQVTDNLRRRGLDYDVVLTESPGHATALARAALDEGCRFLVAVGGDGTIHEVVNGMIDDDRPVAPDAVVGVVSAGTECDFIRTFGLPPLAPHAVAHLDGPESFPIDVGKVVLERDGGSTVRYFVNVAEAGIGADVVAHARRLPRLLGPMAYLVAFWLALARHQPAGARVDLVDRTYDGPLNNLVVANCQFFGRGIKIAPKAVPTDGLLDIQIEHASRRDVIAMLPKAFRGQHLPHPGVLEAKRVRVAVSADRPLRVEADGEILGCTPAAFEIVRDAVRLKV